MTSFKNIQEANKKCVNKRFHTKMPVDYVGEAERAEELLKTHRQMKCPGCGLWAI